MLKPLDRIVKLESTFGDVSWGAGNGFVLFAGPDSFEDEGMVLEVATELKKVTSDLGIPWILKCSFDKANRQSASSFRGHGMDVALNGLARIKSKVGCALISDVHEVSQVAKVAEYAEVLQVPAFLCRQTDLVQAAARAARVLHIKKGQFMAPWDMGAIVNKAREVGQNNILLCERGVSFGYNRLVVDMMSLPEMRGLGVPVVMDATHAVQLPGAQGGSSGGRRDMIPALARAAVAVGVDGLFLETHPNPEKALCDGPNSLFLKDMRPLLIQLKALSEI